MEWHEKDLFWETMAQKLFTSERLKNTPVEVEKIIQLLDIKPDSVILDLCCGPGRHSLEFAKRGHQVTGIDSTQKYLTEARENTQNQGLKIDFVHSDMRDYCNPDHFDIVLNLFTSFGYFKDQSDDKKVLKNIYKSLKEKGKVIIELFGKEILAHHFRERDWYEEQGILFLEERKLSDDWGWLTNRWIKVTENKKEEFIITHRLYSGIELSTLLKNLGFKEVKIYGSIEGIPYNQNAKRLVVVGVK